MGGDQASTVAALDQRVVAGEHHDRRSALGERVARGEHRRAGALALALLGDLDALGQALGDAVAGRA